MSTASSTTSVVSTDNERHRESVPLSSRRLLTHCLKWPMSASSRHRSGRRRRLIIDSTSRLIKLASKAINQSIGDGRQSYKYMCDCLYKMKTSNPGIVTRMEQVNGHFSRACIAHGIFNDAVKFALPVIALDACHLKTKDKGILYVASIITGNFDILIAGTAISNTGAGENKDDWLFFLDALIEGMPWLLVLPSLVVVSDRDKGLLPAVEEKLDKAHHSFCFVHIKRNFVARFHNGLDGTIHNIARATLKMWSRCSRLCATPILSLRHIWRALGLNTGSLLIFQYPDSVSSPQTHPSR